MECEFMSNISHNASVTLEKNTSEASMETDQYGTSLLDDALKLADVSAVSPTLSGLPSSSGSERESDFPFSSTVISGSDDLPVTVSLSIPGEDADLVAPTSDDVLVSGSGSDQLTIKGTVSDVQTALRAVTISASKEIASAETVAYSASISNDQTSNLYSGTIVVLPSVLFSLPQESRAISDSFVMGTDEETSRQQSAVITSDSALTTTAENPIANMLSSGDDAATGAVSLSQSGNVDGSNQASLQITQEDHSITGDSEEVAAKISSDQENTAPVAIYTNREKTYATSITNGSAVPGSGVDISATQDQVSAQGVSSSTAVDAGSLNAAVLPQAGYGVAWLASTASSAVTSTGENSVAAGTATVSAAQDLMTATDQSATATDTKETGLSSGTDAISTASQIDESSISVTSTLSGANTIDVINGVIALNGGTNTVVAQNQGTVSVWSAAGATSFNDASSGDAEFYVTGTGTFDVQDTGSGSATLKVMQLASSDASGTVTGGTRHLDVTTGSGVVSIVAGSGGLDLSTAGSGALQIDVTKGVDHILIAGDQTGNVTVSGALVNADANFGIMGVTSEKVINGNFVVGLTDGNSVTFLGASGSDNITLYLA